MIKKRIMVNKKELETEQELLQLSQTRREDHLWQSQWVANVATVTENSATHNEK